MITFFRDFTGGAFKFIFNGSKSLEISSELSIGLEDFRSIGTIKEQETKDPKWRD